MDNKDLSNPLAVEATLAECKLITSLPSHRNQSLPLTCLLPNWSLAATQNSASRPTAALDRPIAHHGRSPKERLAGQHAQVVRRLGDGLVGTCADAVPWQLKCAAKAVEATLQLRCHAASIRRTLPILS